MEATNWIRSVRRLLWKLQWPNLYLARRTRSLGLRCFANNELSVKHTIRSRRFLFESPRYDTHRILLGAEVGGGSAPGNLHRLLAVPQQLKHTSSPIRPQQKTTTDLLINLSTKTDETHLCSGERRVRTVPRPCSYEYGLIDDNNNNNNKWDTFVHKRELKLADVTLYCELSVTSDVVNFSFAPPKITHLTWFDVVSASVATCIEKKLILAFKV